MVYFKTRLAADKTAATDFATTAGGSLFAASVDGSFNGRGATVIIFDDPLDMDDAGSAVKRQQVNDRFATAIMSRLNNSKKGRVVINGHRLHEDDLSGFVLASGGWTHIALPFIAPKDDTYDLGGRVWRRQKGELLRPKDFSNVEIERVKLCINPDFELLYQQSLGESRSISIIGTDFGSADVSPKGVAVVISVDPGHRAGPGHSFTVMQAWTKVRETYILLEQWRAQADIEEVAAALKHAVRSCQPTMVLIEQTGFGLTLARELRKQHPKTNVREVFPDGRTKVSRLLQHAHLIKSRRIELASGASWRQHFVDEFEQFPNSEFDDQVDTLTLAMDFFAEDPMLQPPKPRPLGGVLNSRGLYTPAEQQVGRSPHVFSRVQASGSTIFPAIEASTKFRNPEGRVEIINQDGALFATVVDD